jgi:hypothetical protein
LVYFSGKAIKTAILVKFTIDIAAKRRKKHKNQISELVISMGYETKIREF